MGYVIAIILILELAYLVRLKIVDTQNKIKLVEDKLKETKEVINSIVDMKSESVTQNWAISSCSLKEQTTLLSVLRGTDLEHGKDKHSKSITKMLRFIIVDNADKKESYMSDTIIEQRNVVSMLTNKYRVNSHWVDHVIQAGYLIAKKHPNNYTRAYWGKVAFMANQGIKKEKKIQKIISRYNDIYTRGYN